MAARARRNVRNPPLEDIPDLEPVDVFVEARENPPEVPAFRFALTPGTYAAGMINMSSPAGQKVYKSATTKLPIEIDCTPTNLKLFLSSLEDHAMQYGWNNILSIPDDVENPNGPSKDLLSEYGLIEMSHIRDHVDTYVETESREAQDSIMLFQCLKNSLTDSARAKILLHKGDYTVANNHASGPLLLKVIIRESYIDTNATTRFIRDRLSSLDTYMKTVDSDIIKFNQFVQDQLNSLNARGQQTEDLLSNLFKGYATASDRNFTEYIGKKQDEFDEGVDIDPQRLMQLALNKYQTLVEGGKWNAPTEAESKIIALEAEVKKMKSNKGASNKNKKADAKEEKAKKPYEKPKWMTIEPAAGKPKEKKVDGKMYYWCKNHKQWTRHKPSECRGTGKETKVGNKPKPKEKESGKKSDPKETQAKIVQALTTIADDDEEDDE